MIDLSFDELSLIAQIRNVSNYQNKSKWEFEKALSEPEIKPKPKPERKAETKPKREPKFRKDFDELRHKFSKKEIKEYRKAFYNVKNYKNLSVSEIKQAGKNFTKLKKVWDLKIFWVTLLALIIKTLIIMIIIVILPMMMNTEKLEVSEHYLKSLIKIITNQ